MHQRMVIAKRLLVLAKQLVESTLQIHDYPELRGVLKVSTDAGGCETLSGAFKRSQKMGNPIFFEDLTANTAEDIEFQPNTTYEFYFMTPNVLSKERLEEFESKHIFPWTQELQDKFAAACAG